MIEEQIVPGGNPGFSGWLIPIRDQLLLCHNKDMKNITYREYNLTFVQVPNGFYIIAESIDEEFRTDTLPTLQAAIDAIKVLCDEAYIWQNLELVVE